MPLDQTHDPALRSWVSSANAPGADFPVQNLPLGLFEAGRRPSPRVGAAIGDHILDLRACAEAGLLTALAPETAAACLEPALNALMSLGRGPRRALRAQLSEWLRSDASAPRERLERLLVRRTDAVLHVPALIGDYTDFYASIHHATNVGSMLRPDEPLLPNYKYIPIGYHGRASSVVASGAPVVRPAGQRKTEDAFEPVFGPTRRLDYELELGAFVGPGNRLGEPIPVDRAEEHLVGVCLVNDWSARDIQQWEYQPLGPFLAKSFATSVSPWIVTLEALEPFRCAPAPRDPADPPPLAYLRLPQGAEPGAFDVRLEVALATARMRQAGEPPHVVSRSSARHLYWTLAQMIAHHSSNGCNLRSGDLLASGTVSGPTRESRGCLLELTWRGTQPLELPDGETRRFLEDGDEVVLRGWCERAGFVRIGLGECRGVVAPAPDT
jgi:fumarylacetoacetase